MSVVTHLYAFAAGAGVGLWAYSGRLLPLALAAFIAGAGYLSTCQPKP